MVVVHADNVSGSGGQAHRGIEHFICLSTGNATGANYLVILWHAQSLATHFVLDDGTTDKNKNILFNFIYEMNISAHNVNDLYRVDTLYIHIVQLNIKHIIKNIMTFFQLIITINFKHKKILSKPHCILFPIFIFLCCQTLLYYTLPVYNFTSTSLFRCCST